MGRLIERSLKNLSGCNSTVHIEGLFISQSYLSIAPRYAHLCQISSGRLALGALRSPGHYGEIMRIQAWVSFNLLKE
ncbi:MAG: hypothetical protein QG649_363 [Patescibacteria group bacterium]|nr:hypothetical protein [Patescibacteria group bacterium]